MTFDQLNNTISKLQDLIEDSLVPQDLRDALLKHFDYLQEETEKLYPKEYVENLIGRSTLAIMETGLSYADARKRAIDDYLHTKRLEESRKEFFMKMNVCFKCFQQLNSSHQCQKKN